MAKKFEIKSTDEDGKPQTYSYKVVYMDCVAQIEAWHTLVNVCLNIIGPALGAGNEAERILAIAEHLPHVLRNSTPAQFMEIMDFCTDQGTCTSHDPPALDRRAWSEHFRGRMGDAGAYAWEVIRYNFANFTEHSLRLKVKLEKADKAKAKSKS